MAKILIKNATTVQNNEVTICDLRIADGKIVAIAPTLVEHTDEIVYDANKQLLTYGFCDLHVHFREPGRPDKETIFTGALAAAHGGYTTVCTMPNLNPCPDTYESLEIQLELIKKQAVIDVLPYGTLTKERAGNLPVQMVTMKTAAVAFSDDGSGIQDEAVMRALMLQAANENVIIAAHCEDNTLLNDGYIHQGNYAKTHQHKGICSESEWKQLARDLALAKETGCRYHACHISTKESVELIRQYKAAGARVTCETAPHYLVLCDEDLQEDGRFKMNPPLRTHADRDALLAGIQDGTIDCIATDHAPHTQPEKCNGLKDSAFGIVGLETAFPILYTKLVRPGILSLPQLIQLLTNNPRRIFNIEGELADGQPADLALFNLDAAYTISTDDFFSKGKATPFDGWHVYGKCMWTMKNGKIVRTW